MLVFLVMSLPPLQAQNTLIFSCAATTTESDIQRNFQPFAPVRLFSEGCTYNQKVARISLPSCSGISLNDNNKRRYGLQSGQLSKLRNRCCGYLRQCGIAVTVELELPPSWVFKLFLVALSAFLGALLGFPGLRLANIHLDSLYYSEGQPFLQMALHLSFVSPLIPLLLWIRPLSRELLTSAGSNPRLHQAIDSDPSISDENYENIRIYTVLSVCLLRFLLTRRSLQVYLNMAFERVKKLKKESGRITNIDLQKRVARVFYYLSAAALQYLAPVILLMFLGLSWKLLDSIAISSGNATLDKINNSTVLSDTTKEYIAVLRGALFRVELLQGVVSYFIWWTLLSSFVTSVFGVVYLKMFSM